MKSGEEIEFCYQHYQRKNLKTIRNMYKLPTITVEGRMELDLGGVS
ncbi:hypothetical protein KHA80_22445 [Anaerobacillus sp. HL2]|nr:hypothetical protein KHA80_22445 [Anaerobacillus sp. HL2]